MTTQAYADLAAVEDAERQANEARRELRRLARESRYEQNRREQKAMAQGIATAATAMAIVWGFYLLWI